MAHGAQRHAVVEVVAAVREQTTLDDVMGIYAGCSTGDTRVLIAGEDGFAELVAAEKDSHTSSIQPRSGKQLSLVEEVVHLRLAVGIASSARLSCGFGMLQVEPCAVLCAERGIFLTEVFGINATVKHRQPDLRS